MKKDSTIKQSERPGIMYQSDASVTEFDEDLLEEHEESDNKVSIKAAVPSIPPLPVEESSSVEFMRHEIFLIELVLLTQNQRWKHAARCIKMSSSCKTGCCRFNFPRLVQRASEMDENGRITGKRTIGSEYINSFNQFYSRLLGQTTTFRFLLCCAHEIYYTIKYVVKDQKSIDNVAAITLASYTKRLEREREIKELSTAQSVYGRIASMAYARSEMVEVGAVTAVHYLLHSTTLVCSHDFQSLHLGRHLTDVEEAESDVGIVP